mgnify:CR=1 FL=1
MPSKSAFSAPLKPGDSESQTVGCRQNNPSICKFNSVESVCALVREDGICLHPSVKWAAQYRKLLEDANGNKTPR